ncbi:MAG: aminotransferase class I/II-fold pyridoxal phosphate-dependent enzyme [Oscillospiraceae bacterium]|nr:aminotransferase class I/II-fold pyridoxal phosphate-dependent enzyme [Oscillospiraceae bacterium]
MNYDGILSENVKSLKPSGIRKFFDILETMDDAISLGIGEPDFVTPWHIRDAGVYSLEKGFTKYTGNAGLLRLRTAICAYLKRRFDLTYSPEQLVVTVGGSEGIDLAIRALVDPDDEVIIPVPSFVCYGPMVTLACGKPVYVETKVENEFRLTADELRAAITPRTKALVLPFPNNPTGAVMDRQSIEEIAQVLRGTDIMVISDEIYSELTYGQHHVSIANIPGMYERTVLVNGFSKSYAMTGWRMGYVCAPLPIAKQMLKIHQYAIMCAPTTSQYAAIEALQRGDEDIEKMRQEYDRRRRYVVDTLRAMDIECFEPRGAFYVFPCIKSTGLSCEEFCEQLLVKKRVAVIPGTAFGDGGEGFVRMSYCNSVANLTEALGRIKEFISEL